jgi:hypothetical protein
MTPQAVIFRSCDSTEHGRMCRPWLVEFGETKGDRTLYLRIPFRTDRGGMGGSCGGCGESPISPRGRGSTTFHWHVADVSTRISLAAMLAACAGGRRLRWAFESVGGSASAGRRNTSRRHSATRRRMAVRSL